MPSIKSASVNRPIQPANPISSLVAGTKKPLFFNIINYKLQSTTHQATVARRNARERNRIKQVNTGFAVLRQHIPASFCDETAKDSSNNSDTGSGRSSSRGSGKSRKFSKLNTLISAARYIHSLQKTLSNSAASEDVSATENFIDGAQACATPPNYTDVSSPSSSDCHGSEHSDFTGSSQSDGCGGSSSGVTANNDLFDDCDDAPKGNELFNAISWWQTSQ